MLSREIFIACYGLGFRLLGSQATGVFVYFRWFLEVSRSLEGRCLKARAPRSQEPLLRAPEPFWRSQSLSGGLLSLQEYYDGSQPPKHESWDKAKWFVRRDELTSLWRFLIKFASILFAEFVLEIYINNFITFDASAIFNDFELSCLFFICSGDCVISDSQHLALMFRRLLSARLTLICLAIWRLYFSILLFFSWSRFVDFPPRQSLYQG